MNYSILTNDANKVINTIFNCVRKGKDVNKTEIKTWGIKKNDKNEDLLVHTDQWEEKCCLELKANNKNDEVFVKFYYWSSFPEEQRSDADNRYLLGRFTELLFVHFRNFFNQVILS